MPPKAAAGNAVLVAADGALLHAHSQLIELVSDPLSTAVQLAEAQTEQEQLLRILLPGVSSLAAGLFLASQYTPYSRIKLEVLLDSLPADRVLDLGTIAHSTQWSTGHGAQVHRRRGWAGRCLAHALKRSVGGCDCAEQAAFWAAECGCPLHVGARGRAQPGGQGQRCWGAAGGLSEGGAAQAAQVQLARWLDCCRRAGADRLLQCDSRACPDTTGLAVLRDGLRAVIR